MQSISLIPAGGTVEDAHPFTAGPLNEDTDSAVSPLAEYESGHGLV